MDAGRSAMTTATLISCPPARRTHHPKAGFQPPERRINVIKDSASGFNKLKASNRRTGSPERPLERGYFVKPTVFVGVNNKMRIAQEEIFAPVAALIPFQDENDAVFQGNETTYGLGAGVWTRDISRAHKVARGLKA